MKPRNEPSNRKPDPTPEEIAEARAEIRMARRRRRSSKMRRWKPLPYKRKRDKE